MAAVTKASTADIKPNSHIGSGALPQRQPAPWPASMRGPRLCISAVTLTRFRAAAPAIMVVLRRLIL